MVLFNSHILNWREESFLCNEIEADIKDNLKYGLKANQIPCLSCESGSEVNI